MSFIWTLQKWDKGGRPTREYSEQRKRFKVELAEEILRIATLPDHTKIGSREWAYIFEHCGIHKGDFDWAEGIICELRCEGLVPLWVCTEDSSREAMGVESIDDKTPEEIAEFALMVADRVVSNYTPFSFWDSQDYYVELWTEKQSLRNIFAPVCAEFRVPVANAKGWSDLHMRANAMKRFAKWEELGKQCVLLYFGDFDPVGLQISEFIKSNMLELEHAQGVNWRPDNLIIDRFGLSMDFIEEHGISWIENLETGSGKQADIRKEPARSYVAKYGIRKAEASSVVVHQEAVRRLCRETILKYIDEDKAREYEDELGQHREAANSALKDLLDAA